MKPEETEIKEENAEDPAPVSGDVIGDTAYSERFVLKILLKLANLDILKDEVKEKSFEEDLCTLWDMTAERDVVLFLQKHDVLNLFEFALPTIENPRLIEVILGVIGNLCCQQEILDNLLKMDSFLTKLLEFIKSDDSPILIQLLRLVSAATFKAHDYELEKWMTVFKSLEYPSALYFILKNCSNKEVLVTAMENFNTLTTYFNTEKFRGEYFKSFVTVEALESLSAAFTELVVTQRDSIDTEDLERILVISLQITLNLVGFDRSTTVYKDSKGDMLKIINVVLAYYENKMVNQKEFDEDLVDIIDSTNTLVNLLVLSEVSEPEQYFSPSLNIWKAIKSLVIPEKNGSGSDDGSDQLRDFARDIKPTLGTLICSYVEKCPEKHLVSVLDQIDSEYEDIVSCVTDDKMKANIVERTSNHRSRLKDNVDS